MVVTNNLPAVQKEIVLDSTFALSLTLEQRDVFTIFVLKDGIKTLFSVVDINNLNQSKVLTDSLKACQS